MFWRRFRSDFTSEFRLKPDEIWASRLKIFGTNIFAPKKNGKNHKFFSWNNNLNEWNYSLRFRFFYIAINFYFKHEKWTNFEEFCEKNDRKCWTIVKNPSEPRVFSTKFGLPGRMIFRSMNPKALIYCIYSALPHNYNLLGPKEFIVN